MAGPGGCAGGNETGAGCGEKSVIILVAFALGVVVTLRSSSNPKFGRDQPRAAPRYCDLVSDRHDLSGSAQLALAASKSWVEALLSGITERRAATAVRLPCACLVARGRGAVRPK